MRGAYIGRLKLKRRYGNDFFERGKLSTVLLSKIRPPNLGFHFPHCSINIIMFKFNSLCLKGGVCCFVTDPHRIGKPIISPDTINKPCNQVNDIDSDTNGIKISCLIGNVFVT